MVYIPYLTKAPFKEYKITYRSSQASPGRSRHLWSEQSHGDRPLFLRRNNFERYQEQHINITDAHFTR
jgi:hypothetical protein